MRKGINYIIIIFTAIFLLFSIAGCSFMGITIEPPKITVEKPEQEQASKTQKKDVTLEEKKESGHEVLADFDQAISQVADSVLPSIVNIKVMVARRDLYGNMRQGEGVGSGIIYSSDGYIITSTHVVSSARELTVTLTNGEEYTAELVGSNEDTDIAVIKIDAEGLQPAKFTSSENAKVGQLAIAIGSPFGLSESVTMGVISAKGRDVAISYNGLPLVDLVQTDAAINPGNSGGALVNTAGQALGVNTMIYSTTGSNAGVGFAIPSEIALNIADKLINSGEVETPFIGIEMGENSTDVEGVYVSSVIDGYPAQEAGIKEGDIITAIDDEPVKEPMDLIAQIIRYEVGDSITVTVNRNGEVLEISLTLSEKPERIRS